MGQRATITDWDIQALVDNELSSEEARIVMEALEQDAEMKRRYMDLKGQKEMLQLWWKDH